MAPRANIWRFNPTNARSSNVSRCVTIEADKCGGRPCIRGMRIRVTDILESVPGGATQDDILRNFPYLEPDDIKAALAYAARQTGHALL